MFLKEKIKLFYSKKEKRLMTVSELTLKSFIAKLEKKAVESNLIAVYATQQTGIAETQNEIIINNANMIIKERRYPDSFWVSI